MEDIASYLFKMTSAVFGHFYNEWGWSGVLFALFWGGALVWFAGYCAWAWVAEKFEKKK